MFSLLYSGFALLVFLSFCLSFFLSFLPHLSPSVCLSVCDMACVVVFVLKSMYSLPSCATQPPLAFHLSSAAAFLTQMNVFL